MESTPSPVLYPSESKCETCRDFGYTPGHYLEIKRLKATSSKGCHLCSLVILGMKQFPQLWDQFGSLDGLRGGLVSFKYHEGKLLRVSITGIGPWGKLVLGFYALTDQSQLLPVAVAPHIPLATSSPNTMSTVKRWLERCAQHQSCFIPDQVPLPSRILDIGGSKIFLRKTGGEMGRYVCLSWCWGSIKPLTTERSTISQRKENISWDTLPLTFKDAIMVTRELGFQFLWIDSLCIIQNDREDWETQSAQITEIYSNSHLTIAVTLSSNAEGGLFRKLGEPVCLPEDLNSPTKRLNSGIFVREVIDHGPLVSNTMEGERFDSGKFPWLCRGWTLQEQKLPKRVLHFTDLEVLLECQHQVTCQCESESSGCEGTKARLYNRFREGKKSEILQEWMMIVQEYTSRLLTKNIDKLPALSGLAKQFQCSLNSKYCAGLWETDLLDSLFWSTKNLATLQPRPSEYIAPTWSWASTNCPIQFFQTPPYPQFNLEDLWYIQATRIPPPRQSRVQSVVCNLASSDPTGILSGGELCITGPAIDVTYHFEDSLPAPYFPYLVVSQAGHSIFFPDYKITALGMDQIKPGQPLVCLNIASPDNIGRCLLKPIVLRQKFEGNREDVFERIGSILPMFLNKRAFEMWFDAEERTIRII